MPTSNHDARRPSRVTVAYEDRALSFMLSKNATFEDLAERLERLGQRRRGKPLAIAVKFVAAPEAQHRRLGPRLGRRRDIGAAAKAWAGGGLRGQWRIGPAHDAKEVAMRILTAAVVIGPLMLMGGPSIAAQSRPTPGSSAPAQSAAAAGSSTADRDTYAHEARDAMQHWRRKLRDFGAQAKAEGEKAGSATEKDLNEAWAKANAASRKLQNVGAKSWASAKTSYEQASRELASAWDKDRPRDK